MIIVVLIGALLLVPLLGGSFRKLREARLQHEYAMFGVLIAQLLVRAQVSNRYLMGSWSVSMWAFLNLLILRLLWPSRSYRGVSLMILGLILNLFVVLANGSMPVMGVQDSTAIPEGFYRLASAGDHLSVLGDVLPIGKNAVVSLGDLLLTIGLVVLVLSAAAGEEQCGTRKRSSSCGA